jgi:hypothetical protein
MDRTMSSASIRQTNGSHKRTARIRTHRRAAGFTGITLRRRLRTLGALSLTETSHLFDTLAEAVDGLHHEGALHGALCPENIWLMPGGTIRVFRPVPEAVAESRAHMARIGYATPREQAGELPTRSSDIRALGNLLFDVLVGTATPESGPRTGERLAEIGDLVAPAGPIIDAALTDATVDGYPSAQAMADALRAVAPQEALETARHSMRAALPPLVYPTAPTPHAAAAPIRPALQPARPTGIRGRPLLRPVGSDHSA